MPRLLNRAACDTCRQRKVKCDEQSPVCGQCAKSGRYCGRPVGDTVFREYSVPSPKSPEIKEKTKQKLPTPEYPRAALQQHEIAQYFHHYMLHLAKWYDLGDATNQFEKAVSETAMDEPLLFSAVLALSAMHTAQTRTKSALQAAQYYHGHCVRLLIALDSESRHLENGVALAAACLLRSYEILGEEDDPNRHLLGAYSLAAFESRSSESATGPVIPSALLAAGFWNYLREDITFSLFQCCPLKMDLAAAGAADRPLREGHLNSISIILGKIVNSYFGNPVYHENWDSLFNETQVWQANLPVALQPYCVVDAQLGRFPELWFLQDFYASARHYILVSLSILARFASESQLGRLTAAHYNNERDPDRDELLENFALEICGVAFTTNIPSVVVNAFGPIAYCGKFIRSEPAQLEVIRHLSACKKTIGWPVEHLIKSLKSSWGCE